MEIKLNILENSHDFLFNSFDLYKVADEYGTHDAERSSLENKVKWKLSYITLVQAFELLLKAVLNSIHESLIYADVDYPKDTVTYNQAIKRINNYNGLKIDVKEIELIQSCFKRRNDLMHHVVEITSEEIKTKYSKLFELYKKIHIGFLNIDIEYKSDVYKYIENELLQFAKGYVCYRGLEFSPQALKDFKEDLLEGQLNKHFITVEGEIVDRIKYGEETFIINGEEKKLTNTYCGDCAAKLGEYHLGGCDWEVCPVCKGQLLSCDCIKDWCE
jgi:hypothetical protein